MTEPDSGPKPPVDDTAPLPRDYAPRASDIVRYILLLHQGDHVETVPLRPGTPLVVGREPPADIILSHASVSRLHARIGVTDGRIAVDDLDSRNGTLLGGEPVQHAIVLPGQELSFGAVVGQIHVVGSDQTPGFERHGAFLTLLDSEVRRASFFGHGGAVLLLRSLPEHALRRSCARLRHLLRPVDKAAFYGPGELEILLPLATEEAALAAARALVHAASEYGQTTCGAATFTPADAQGEEVLRRAREAALAATPAAPVQHRAAPSTRVLSGGDDTSVPAEVAPVAKSDRMRSVLDLAQRLARSRIPILLLGETGTGKEVLAGFVHGASPRSAKPLIAVNCAAIPRSLLESTLFGHERGAFTGAVNAQRGVFEAAQGGTVFLDEVGELSLDAQAALLRVIESQRVTRVGSTAEISVDVRVLAATHRDLERMTVEGRFRQDLLYRLNVAVVEIPPLRRRRDDIAALAQRFLLMANRANDRRIARISDSAMAMLERYAWPGNARELRNAIERAAVIAPADVILPADLPERVRTAMVSAALPETSEVPTDSSDFPAPASPRIPPAGAEEKGTLRDTMNRLEREVLSRALSGTGWNVTEAARRLDVPLRTLQHKLRTHGLRRPGS